MTGAKHTLDRQRAASGLSGHVETPNAVIAALVLSASISALAGYTVLSRALPIALRPAATI